MPNRGQDHHNTHLTDIDIMNIKDLCREKEYHQVCLKNLSDKAISKRFGIGVKALRQIRLGHSWKHIK